ncbi:hypothetical protein EMCRGX_G023849 [Ephydatia muelleri]
MAGVWEACINKSLPWSGTERLRLLQQLNSLTYPLSDLRPDLVENVLRYFMTPPEMMGAVEIIAFAQLVSNVVTRQHTTLCPSLHSDLLQRLMLHVSSIPDPAELLYACAELVEQTPPSTEVLSELFSLTGPLITVLTKPNSPATSKRGSLRCIAVLCCNPEIPQARLHELLAVLTSILANMKDQKQLHDGSKYLLSLLRTLHALVLNLASVRSLESMPRLLSTLKSYMCTGLHLPNVQATDSQSRHSYSLSTQCHTHPWEQQCHTHPRGNSSATPTRGNSSATPTRGNSSATPTCGNSDGSSSVVSYSSDSEFSDSNEPVAEKAKFTNSRIRHQVHVCLAAIFQSLDHQTTFSYSQSFLPDALQQQSLLFCILKDPASKCRTAAVTLLTVMLTGSKPYFGPAKDGVLTSQPYTPYSYTLGSMVRELHWCLLLAATTETNALTLTQILKCLAILVLNTPYHQLSDGYVTRILGALPPSLNHRDTDVQVAALTCYGALFSLTPQHCEVVKWLATPSTDIVSHCLALLSSPGAGLALKTEALQVLTSMTKFYFSAMKDRWEAIGQLYFTHMASAPPSLQLHVLKLLEEICRALSNHTEQEVPGVVRFWDQLLTSPLQQTLQDATAQSLCSQACSLLSTIGERRGGLYKDADPFLPGDHVLSRLSVGKRTLALTLPLGLCKEDEATCHSVCASAVRVLGVFVTYESLKLDLHFLLDCHSMILHCLSSPSLSVRVQASWSLGNLTDTLTGMEDIPLPLYTPLFGAVHTAMLDNEKVRCNAVRACGNLLRCLNKKALVTHRAQITDLCVLLAKAAVSGGMKCRWNACYACHSAFLNATLIEECADEMAPLIRSLCSAVHQCKNFKVRINAALALGTPHQYGCSQFQAVWAAVMDGLENSEDEIEFTEYKHAVALKTQLCTAIMHLVTVMQPVHCKETVLCIREEQLCKTLAECLKRDKVLPEVLEKAEINLELLKGCNNVDVLRRVLTTVKEFTDQHQLPPCEFTDQHQLPRE